MLLAWQQLMVHEIDPDFVVTYESEALRYAQRMPRYADVC
jgi:hypothetical protein